MRVSRRTLLRALLPALAAGVSRRSFAARAAPERRGPTRPHTIRLGILRPPEPQGRCAAAMLGVELGLAEAAQTAALVGGGLERTTVEVRSVAEAAEQVRTLAAVGAQAVITSLDGESAFAALQAISETEMVHLPLGAVAIPWTSERGSARRFDVVLGGPARARALAEALAEAGLRSCRVCADSRLPMAVAVLSQALRAAGVEPTGSGVCHGPSELLQALRAGQAEAARAVVVAWLDAIPSELQREIDGWRDRPLLALALAPEERPAVASSAVWAIEWHQELQRYGAEQLNQRFERRFGSEMDGPAWSGWAAVKAVAEASLRTGARDGPALAEALRTLSFDGHKGEPLSFDASGRLAQPAYVIGRLPGEGVGPPRLVHESAGEPARA